MRFPFCFLAYFAAFFLLGFSHWLGASFDNPSIDQILYHLHYSDGMGIDTSGGSSSLLSPRNAWHFR